jgi:hypothetical protein
LLRFKRFFPVGKSRKKTKPSLIGDKTLYLNNIWWLSSPVKQNTPGDSVTGQGRFQIWQQLSTSWQTTANSLELGWWFILPSTLVIAFQTTSG